MRLREFGKWISRSSTGRWPVRGPVRRSPSNTFTSVIAVEGVVMFIHFLGAAPTHDSGYYTLTTAQGTSLSLSPNRGADHALPLLRSVASCWVGDRLRITCAMCALLDPFGEFRVQAEGICVRDASQIRFAECWVTFNVGDSWSKGRFRINGLSSPISSCDTGTSNTHIDDVGITKLPQSLLQVPLSSDAFGVKHFELRSLFPLPARPSSLYA